MTTLDVFAVEYDDLLPEGRTVRTVGVALTRAGARDLADAEGAGTDTPSPTTAAVLASTDPETSRLRQSHYKGNFWIFTQSVDRSPGEAAERALAGEVAKDLLKVARRHGWRRLEITTRPGDGSDGRRRITGRCVDALGLSWRWEADDELNFSLAPVARS